jgi:hypothetical protein
MNKLAAWSPSEGALIGDGSLSHENAGERFKDSLDVNELSGARSSDRLLVRRLGGDEVEAVEMEAV